jgi:exopolysaccharide biosynthesis WecB/TagA/CpsF family protein
MSTATCAIDWPKKYDVLGVNVSATSYADATRAIIEAAQARVPAVVSLHAVHAVVTASGDEQLRDKVNQFELIGPDGQPVRWALNLLYGAKLKERVYGPHLTLWLCEAAAREGVGVFLYGGANDQVLDKLEHNLCEKYPGLQIVGRYCPPFRPLTDEEDAAVVQQINESGAGLVFIGLGCPKQDHWAADHRDRIHAVQVCVGAAFDFHAGSKRMAPAWMQRRGLEWLFRLCEEPKRLWKRYLVTNTVFVSKLVWQFTRQIFVSPRSN